MSIFTSILSVELSPSFPLRLWGTGFLSCGALGALPDRAAEGGTEGCRIWGSQHQTWPWQAEQDEDDNRQLGQVLGEKVLSLWDAKCCSRTGLNIDPHSAQKSRGLYFETGF